MTTHNLATTYQLAGRLPRRSPTWNASATPRSPGKAATMPTPCAAPSDLADAYKAAGRSRGDRTPRAHPHQPDRQARPGTSRLRTTLDNLAAAYQAAGRLPDAIAVLEIRRDDRSPGSAPTTPDPRHAQQPRRAVLEDKAARQIRADLRGPDQAGRGQGRTPEPAVLLIRRQPRGELQGFRPAQGGDPTPRRSLSSVETIPRASRVRQPD